MNLFQRGNFTLHSGEESSFKIDCDALTDDDIECLAEIISKQYVFNKVYGVPSGGLRLQKALEKYVHKYRFFFGERVLIVDDVLTTGKSMEEARALFENDPNVDLIWGVVIFARDQPANWIRSIFEMWYDR